MAARALMRDDCLEPELRLRRRHDGLTRGRTPCSHLHTIHAFAYRRSRDEHWPVSFCDDCLIILAGRDPLLMTRKRPRWKFDERNIAAARWLREWPKSGRPRKRTPPLEIAWPDAA